MMRKEFAEWTVSTPGVHVMARTVDLNFVEYFDSVSRNEGPLIST